jgi:hypothetical protein
VQHLFECIQDSQKKLLATDTNKWGVSLISPISGFQVSLPVTVLDHLEQTEGTNIHFYESETYRLVATYQGCVTLHRDTIVKAKGAWEFVSSLPTDDGNISGNG